MVACPSQWGFPATSIYMDGLTGERRCHHLHESVLHTHVLHRGPAGVRSPADRMFLS